MNKRGKTREKTIANLYWRGRRNAEAAQVVLSRSEDFVLATSFTSDLLFHHEVLLVALALEICSTRTEGMKVEMILREKGQLRVSEVDI